MVFTIAKKKKDSIKISFIDSPSSEDVTGKLVIKGNAELQELQSDSETEEVDTCAIGFHYEPETEEYYDEEE